MDGSCVRKWDTSSQWWTDGNGIMRKESALIEITAVGHFLEISAGHATNLHATNGRRGLGPARSAPPRHRGAPIAPTADATGVSPFYRRRPIQRRKHIACFLYWYYLTFFNSHFHSQFHSQFHFHFQFHFENSENQLVLELESLTMVSDDGLHKSVDWISWLMMPSLVTGVIGRFWVVGPRGGGSRESRQSRDPHFLTASIKTQKCVCVSVCRPLWLNRRLPWPRLLCYSFYLIFFPRSFPSLYNRRRFLYFKFLLIELFIFSTGGKFACKYLGEYTVSWLSFCPSVCLSVCLSLCPDGKR